MRHAAAALSALLLIAACDATGPDVSTYTLETVNGDPLPFPYDWYSGAPLEIVDGGFEFEGRGDVDEWVRVRCRANLPPETECQVTGDGIIRRDGIFNALENRLYLGAGDWVPMQIGAETATIQYGPAFEWHFQYVRE